MSDESNDDKEIISKEMFDKLTNKALYNVSNIYVVAMGYSEGELYTIELQGNNIITICWDSGFQPEIFHKIEFHFPAIMNKATGIFLNLKPEIASRIYKRHGNVIKEFAKENKLTFMNRTEVELD